VTDENSAVERSLSAASGPGAGAPHYAFVASVLTAGHTIACIALMLLPAMAPAVARDYGVDPSLIGYQFSIMGVGLLSSLVLFGNLSRRFGACRTNQLGHAMVAGGLLLMLVPAIAFLVPGSLLMGCAFGLLGPSNSSLLMRFTPPGRRNFVFSVQQTSIPLGGAIAGLAAPAVAVTFGWRWMLVLNVLLLLALVVFLQRVRARWDDERDIRAPIIARNPFAGFLANWRDRRLRLFSIAGGAFCYAQFCVAAYTVVACVEVGGMSLIAAGTVLMVVNLSTAAGRAVGGWLADWLRSPTRILECAGWVTLALCVGLLWLSPSWPAFLIYGVFSLLGVSSCVWAGLVLAEVARIAPKGEVAMITSGTLVFTNIGKMLGPMVFAAVYALAGSYGVAFASVAVPAVVATYCVIAVQRETARSFIPSRRQRETS
jgi:MFS family permease